MTDWNILTAARTIWQEARGEPLVAQQAVAHVIINRLRSMRWGSTLAEVCLSHAQFSAWGRAADPNFAASCLLPDDDQKLAVFVGLLESAQHDPDPTQGATHYYAMSIAPPAWVKDATFCGAFGHQVFYRDVK